MAVPLKAKQMAEDVRSSTPESVLMKENEKNYDLKGEEKDFRKREENTKTCAETAENKEQKRDNLKTLPSYKIGQ